MEQINETLSLSVIVKDFLHTCLQLEFDISK